MYQPKKSEIKDILKQRRNEKRMDTIGLIITGVLLGASIVLLAHAYLISLTLR